MKKEKEIFKKYLVGKGLKLTSERELILEEVFSRHDHFDAEALFQAFRARSENVSRATIYRTLPLLVESGLVQEALRCGERVCYEHIYGHKSHGHMICIGCGKIIEFENKALEKIRKKVCEEYGFKPVEFRFGIKGYCKDCQKKL
ncbi:transcriptional repressor [candidate division WOR-3 bacterium]|nr:transcriptional repressor [candidate division WOR-3 bacterium]